MTNPFISALFSGWESFTSKTPAQKTPELQFGAGGGDFQPALFKKRKLSAAKGTLWVQTPRVTPCAPGRVHAQGEWSGAEMGGFLPTPCVCRISWVYCPLRQALGAEQPPRLHARSAAQIIPAASGCRHRSRRRLPPAAPQSPGKAKPYKLFVPG